MKTLATSAGKTIGAPVGARPMSREAETAGLDALQLGHLLYFDNLSPRAARELIQRLSQRLREADDRIVNDDRRSGRAHGTGKDGRQPNGCRVSVSRGQESVVDASVPRS